MIQYLKQWRHVLRLFPMNILEIGLTINQQCGAAPYSSFVRNEIASTDRTCKDCLGKQFFKRNK
jgi:hypothetical protein